MWVLWGLGVLGSVICVAVLWLIFGPIVKHLAGKR